jgi:limonene-1,2-epoxide hydrolase
MSIVREFADAFNRQDVTALVDLFTETGSYDDIFFGPHQGRAALRQMFERIFREGKGYHWRFDTIVEDGRHAAGEWRFSYTVSEAVPRSAGRPVRFKGMSVFDLDGDKIAAYREYADSGVALLQLGFSPEALAKVLGKRVPRGD